MIIPYNVLYPAVATGVGVTSGIRECWSLYTVPSSNKHSSWNPTLVFSHTACYTKACITTHSSHMFHSPLWSITCEQQAFHIDEYMYSCMLQVPRIFDLLIFNFDCDHKMVTGSTLLTVQVLYSSFPSPLLLSSPPLQLHNYIGLPWCDYCRNFMWGLRNQGHRCKGKHH